MKKKTKGPGPAAWLRENKWTCIVLAAALAVLLAAAIAVPLITDRSFAPLAAAAGYGLAVWYGFRQLDGMSGDISGFGLTLGELAGAAVLCLVR